MVRRLLGGGWSLLIVGILVGVGVSVLLANWPPAEGARPPRPEAAAVAVPATAAKGQGAESRAADRPAAPKPSPDRDASVIPQETPERASKSAPQLTALPRATQPAVPAQEPPAWLRNAVATPDIAGRPMIAVVIDDLGLNRHKAERVIALPGPLTLAFMTYADDLARQTHAAHAAGHELMVHLPMEPLDAGLNSGPNTLEVGLPAGELLRRLRWGLTRFDGYVGINNHMGSRFTGWEPGMALVLEELRARGLLFLDSRTVGNSVAGEVARAVGVPYAGRDIFLDNESSVAAIRDRLAETEAIARRHGFAIAIGHPHDGTIEALHDWLPTLAARGYVLVPISAIVRRTLAAAG